MVSVEQLISSIVSHEKSGKVKSWLSHVLLLLINIIFFFVRIVNHSFLTGLISRNE